jgi:hypothetical protein
MSSVLQAGPTVRTNQLDYDEEVMYKVSELDGQSYLTPVVNAITLGFSIPARVRSRAS